MIEKKPTDPYEAMALLRALADRNLALFSTADAREAGQEVGIGPTYLKVILSRLREGGWIRRLKRGTYALAGGMPGLPPELHPFAVGMALVDPSAVSGWAALNHHRLTEQIPRIIELTTPSRVVTPAMRGVANTERDTGRTGPSIWRAGGVEFEIVSVIRDHFFGYQEEWVGEQKVRIFDKERAVLDCFALPRRYGGIAEGMSLIKEHLDELDVELLVEYAQQYGVGAVAKRVGYALEVAGAAREVKEAIEPLQQLPMNGYRLLDPTRPARGNRLPKWGLRKNVGTGEA